MDIFALLILTVVVFLLVYVCALFVVDCDFGLVWAEKFGKPIGKLVTVIIVLLHCNFCATGNVFMVMLFVCFLYFRKKRHAFVCLHVTTYLFFESVK